MTQQEIKKFYEDQAIWYKKQAESETREIEWLTGQMNREKKSVEELREYIWSKGVITEIEMRIWGDKKYESPEYHKYKLQRRRSYLKRKKDLAKAQAYEVKAMEI